MATPEEVNFREQYKEALDVVSERMQKEMDDASIELLTTGSCTVPKKGPDQAWRDFTKVSTIYQGEGQSKWESLAESLVNVASGFIVS